MVLIGSGMVSQACSSACTVCTMLWPHHFSDSQYVRECTANRLAKEASRGNPLMTASARCIADTAQGLRMPDRAEQRSSDAGDCAEATRAAQRTQV